MRVISWLLSLLPQSLLIKAIVTKPHVISVTVMTDKDLHLMQTAWEALEQMKHLDNKAKELHAHVH